MADQQPQTEQSDLSGAPTVLAGDLMEFRRAKTTIEELGERHDHAALEGIRRKMGEYYRMLHRSLLNERRAIKFGDRHVTGVVYRRDAYRPDDYPTGDLWDIVAFQSGGWLFTYAVSSSGNDAWLDTAHNTDTGERVDNDRWDVPAADTFRVAVDAINSLDHNDLADFPDVDPSRLDKHPPI